MSEEPGNEIFEKYILKWYFCEIYFSKIPCVIILRSKNERYNLHADHCDICIEQYPQYTTNILMSRTLPELTVPDFYVRICNMCDRKYVKSNIHNAIFKEIENILGRDLSMLVVQYLLN
jgi:hypothetical protein